MTDRDLMQQALEALEWWEDDFGSSKEPSPVIIALRSRLAPPEQESVTWVPPKMHPVMELRAQRWFRVYRIDDREKNT